MLFAEVAEVSRTLAATRSRTAKRDALAAVLTRADPADIDVAVPMLSGELRQRRTGIGWASLADLPEPADRPTLTVLQVDAELEAISRLHGAGSAAARTAAVRDLFGRATADEQRLLRGLLSGDVRQGAADAAMLDAIAAASGVPLAHVRRAAMLGGATVPVARAALLSGADAVAEIHLEVGRPVRPMLASSAPDVDAALAGMAGPASVDVKLDGIRVQVHRSGDEVGVFTRSLDDITARLPEVVAGVRALPTPEVVLDGEVIALDPSGRPRAFQETASRTATRLAEATPAGTALSVYYFDCLRADGADLVDRPLRDRLARLDAIVPAEAVVSRLLDADPAGAAAFFQRAVAAGQEGVVVKALDAPYAAGRRGAAWVKVKPRHTLDLVVLAVEWGSGRRRGWLSNIHLGARDPEGGFVMLGKTFKGMTDQMLAWQTERFLELETGRSGHVVQVRPEQVVEIAFDGLQRSSRYPGGLALRFARVLRYRDDKTAAEADTLATVRALAGPAQG